MRARPAARGTGAPSLPPGRADAAERESHTSTLPCRRESVNARSTRHAAVHERWPGRPIGTAPKGSRCRASLRRETPPRHARNEALRSWSPWTRAVSSSVDDGGIVRLSRSRRALVDRSRADVTSCEDGLTQASASVQGDHRRAAIAAARLARPNRAPAQSASSDGSAPRESAGGYLAPAHATNLD